MSSQTYHSIIVRGHNFIDLVMREFIMGDSVNYSREDFLKQMLEVSYDDSSKQRITNNLILPNGLPIPNLEAIREKVFQDIHESFDLGTTYRVQYLNEVAGRDLIFLVIQNENPNYV